MHETETMEVAGGWLGKCSCGWRTDRFYTLSYDASDAADAHEMDAKALRLNTGAKRPKITTLKQYRANAESEVYTENERALWAMMADEIESQVIHDEEIEGQESLF